MLLREKDDSTNPGRISYGSIFFIRIAENPEISKKGGCSEAKSLGIPSLLQILTAITLESRTLFSFSTFGKFLSAPVEALNLGL